MQVERLTETELAIIEALGTYRFLTAPQLLRLGVTKHSRHLGEALRTLLGVPTRRRPSPRRPAVLGRLDFGAMPGRGRLPLVYFLMSHGADLLADARPELAPEEIQHPHRVRLFRSDYFHRIGCVDMHIALRQWARREGARLGFFHTYFDHGAKAGGRPVARTRVALGRGALVPDAVFSFTAREGATRLCAFEMYNGRQTGRVEDQLEAYLIALREAAIERAYGYPHAVRVLAVFDEQRGLELALERLERRAEFREAAPQLFFKTLPEVELDLLHGWRQLGRRSQRLPLFGP